VHYYYFPLSFFLSRSPVFAQTFAPGLLLLPESVLLLLLFYRNPTPAFRAWQCKILCMPVIHSQIVMLLSCCEFAKCCEMDGTAHQANEWSVC